MRHCDICKRSVGRSHDVLCQPCREAIARLIQICKRNPEILQAAPPVVASTPYELEFTTEEHYWSHRA